MRNPELAANETNNPLLVVAGVAASAAFIYQIAAQAQVKSRACHAMGEAVQSGKVFAQSSVTDRVDFRTPDAKQFESDLEEAYQVASGARDQDFFRSIIHARGRYLGAKKLIVYGPPNPSANVVELSVEWARSSVEATERVAMSCR